MCQFTKENKETVLFNVECNKYHRQQRPPMITSDSNIAEIFNGKSKKNTKISFLFQSHNTRWNSKWAKKTGNQQSVSCIQHIPKHFKRKYYFIFSFLIKLCENANKFNDFSFSSKISRCHSSAQKRFPLPRKQLSACQCSAKSIKNIWKYALQPNCITIYKIFSKYQTGFQKGFNPQNCLMAMIENFRNSLDERGEYVALLTGLPKAVDCLPHDLIIAKLHTYGFYKPSLRLM